MSKSGSPIYATYPEGHETIPHLPSLPPGGANPNPPMPHTQGSNYSDESSSHERFPRKGQSSQGPYINLPLGTPGEKEELPTPGGGYYGDSAQPRGNGAGGEYLAAPGSNRKTRFQEAEKGLDGLDDDGSIPLGYRRTKEGKVVPHRYIPVPLETWAISTLVGIMLLGCALMEILLWWSNHTHGWATLDQSSNFGAVHFLYTIPPVVISLPVVAIWAWIDFSIKKLQPYIDLANGSATAERTLFLNYLDSNRFVVWFYTFRNGHYIATLSTFVCLFTLLVSPVASGLFVVRNTQFTHNNQTSLSIDNLGLDPNYTTNAPFVAASGFIQARAQFGVPVPMFTQPDWAVPRFELPNIENGTSNIDTVAIQSFPNCTEASDVVITSVPNGYSVDATFGSCTHTYGVNLLTSTATGIAAFWGSGAFTCNRGTANAPNQTDLRFGPIGFWIFEAPAEGSTDTDNLRSSVVVCQPQMAVVRATAHVDVIKKELLAVDVTGNVTGPGNSITGPPMNGQPFNGLGFDLTNANLYQAERANATNVGFAVAIFQELTLNTPGGLANAWGTDRIRNATQTLYTNFLTLIASRVYFSPAASGDQRPLGGSYTAPEPRLWVAPQAAHILAGAFVLLAIAGAVLGYAHHQARKHLVLSHEPGTIASVASMTGHTEVSVLLEGRDDEKTLRRLLDQHRYRIDVRTGKIVFDGEHGFEDALTPNAQQVQAASAFAHAQSQKLGSPVSATSPSSRPVSGRLGKAAIWRRSKDPGATDEDMEEERRRRLSRLATFRRSGPQSAPPDQANFSHDPQP